MLLVKSMGKQSEMPLNSLQSELPNRTYKSAQWSFLTGEQLQPQLQYIDMYLLNLYDAYKCVCGGLYLPFAFGERFNVH